MGCDVQKNLVENLSIDLSGNYRGILVEDATNADIICRQISVTKLLNQELNIACTVLKVNEENQR